jgi:hypothetical protein
MTGKQTQAIINFTASRQYNKTIVDFCSFIMKGQFHYYGLGSINAFIQIFTDQT